MTTMTGIFATGVLGLNAQSSALGSISGNIANVNTIGYKETDTRFETLVADPNHQPVSPSQQVLNFWQGVRPVEQQRLDRQGIIQASGLHTDFAINGRGFFGVVNSVDPTTGDAGGIGPRMVTREGDFQIDKDGFFRNASGNFLLGIPLGDTGGTLAGSGGSATLASLTPVRLSETASNGGAATTAVRAFANLPATEAAGATPQTLSTTVYDSSGESYVLTLGFTKTAVGNWDMSVQSVTSTDGSSGPTVSVTPTTVPLTFDSDGQLVSPASTVSVGSFVPSNGATLAFTVALAGGDPAGGKMTQLDSAFENGGLKQNGTGLGGALNFSLTPDGILMQTFSNGLSIPRFQVPLVTYTNPNGLEQVSGTAFVPTQDAGPDTVVSPDQGGGGSLASGQVETSNVDLTDEFAQLIVTQRAFSAASKIVTTADEMTKTVAQLGG